MNRAPVADLLTDPARRWSGRAEYLSPPLIDLLRRPPSSRVEADPADGSDDDTEDDFGLARGLAIGVPIGAGMWGAIGLIVWLLLDW